MSITQNWARSDAALEPTAEKAVMSTEAHKEALTSEWQERLLPLMSLMVVGLTIFFFLASFAQLAYLHTSISQSPKMDMVEPLAILSPGPDATIDEMLAASQLKVLATLEANALERRHHQANVLLMSRVWVRYLGFVTGMILALVGSSFILGKLREPSSEVGVNSLAGGASFSSTSPGLILAGLGVVLMLTTIVIHHEITIRDTPLYLEGNMSAAMLKESEAPQVDALDMLDPPALNNEDETTE